MSKKSLEEERDAVDVITDCMYSLGFLADVSNAIFSNVADNISIKRFYEDWLKQSQTPRVVIPFNSGIILGYLYVGILFAKENWFDLVPLDQVDVSDEAWGIRGAIIIAPKEPKPTVRYAVRRIRNSLGHGYPTLSLVGVTKTTELLERATFSFHDVNVRDSADTFDVTLTLGQLVMLVKKFQSTIHRHVREKRE
jgi:HEPN pEK499 p136